MSFINFNSIFIKLLRQSHFPAHRAESAAAELCQRFARGQANCVRQCRHIGVDAPSNGRSLGDTNYKSLSHKFIYEYYSGLLKKCKIGKYCREEYNIVVSVL